MSHIEEDNSFLPDMFEEYAQYFLAESKGDANLFEDTGDNTEMVDTDLGVDYLDALSPDCGFLGGLESSISMGMGREEVGVSN